MPLSLERIVYADLNARQKESYNFHKVAALLADYGYTSLKLDDDWNGADFVAVHCKGGAIFVQLKARFFISQNYLGKGLYIAAPIAGRWYLYDHDEVVALCDRHGIYTNTASWLQGGRVHSTNPNAAVMDAITPPL